MGTWSKIVESFPLTVGDVARQYTRIPVDASDIFYHYTTHAGLEGILRSGGLRATYRKTMNDAGEFDYAKNVIYEELKEINKRHTPWPVTQSLTTYIRKNLDQFLKNSIEMKRSYCACLTVSSDQPKQWEVYAENGMGFVIGFNMREFLNYQVAAIKGEKPHIILGPVIYNENDQRDLVWRLVEVGINDLQAFADICTQKAEDLTALRDRITQQIFVYLFTLIDFIKAPAYISEREMRLIIAANDGTLEASNIQYYERNNESIPFIFMDFRNPRTKRLPLAEIKIGPKSSFSKEKAFLKDLLDELGYDSNETDRPRITQSLVTMG